MDNSKVNISSRHCNKHIVYSIDMFKTVKSVLSWVTKTNGVKFPIDVLKSKNKEWRVKY